MRRTSPLVLIVAIHALGGGASPAFSQSSPSPAASGTPVGTPATLPPDGSWQVDLSSDDLTAAGASAQGSRAGIFTWTFGDGRATISVSYTDGGSVACPAVVQPVGDLVRLSYKGDCGGEVDTIRWALRDDGLHLTLLDTNAPLADNRAYLEAKPWQPVETPAGTPPAAFRCPNPEGGDCLGPIAAGTYTTDRFMWPITYTVPEGWDNEEDLPGNFLLLPPGESLAGVNAGTSDYIGIYWDVFAASQDCQGGKEPGVGRTPKELADWMAGHPGLATGGVRPTSVGGLDGFVVDVRMSPTWTGTCPWSNGQPVVDLIVGDDIVSSLVASIGGELAYRYYFLDAGGTPLTVEAAYTPRAQSFEDYLADVAPVIDSLRFGTE